LTLKLQGGVANDYLEFLLDPLFSGSGVDEYAKLVLYKGARPANLSIVPSAADIVVQYNLRRGAGAYTISSTATEVIANLLVPDPKLAENAGTVTFFRIFPYGANPTALFEGDVTDRNGSGELKLPTTNILLGIYVRVTSAKIVIPIVIN
jgi:hypothetical protein